MNTPLPNTWPAWQAAERLARRELSALALLEACLARIAQRDSEVLAFAHIDAEAARAQARALDAGPWRGPLHGLPLGVKDILDTAELPTAYGSALYAGHRPPADAAAVALCRAAGAVIVGKTVSTELANMHPGPTRNPHRLTHTPGGSSSGSAAAVADAMLPLALGTQTAGSLIRPAAYCGIVAFKPSVNRVPRAGAKLLSDTLDTIGGFGRCVRDAALLGSVLTGDARLAQLPEPTGAVRIGLAQTPHWDAADADSRRVWSEAAARLAAAGARCLGAALPPDFAELLPLQQAVQACETARSLAHEHRQARERLSVPLLALLDAGAAIDGATHAAHLRTVAAARQRVDALFDTHDVLLAPSTLGEAPAGLGHTGDPLFCRSWTLLGLPCVHLPSGHGASGLPVGVQLVGRWGEDHRLLAIAQWAMRQLVPERG